MLLHLYQIEVW